MLKYLFKVMDESHCLFMLLLFVPHERLFGAVSIEYL